MKRSLLILLFLATACGGGEQKEYSKLEGLRILAMIADSPEINSPQAVAVTPYLSYVDGGDTTLDVSYEACLDPGIAYGAEVSCEQAEPGAVISGTATFATSTIGSVNYYTGPMDPISLNIDAAAFTFLGSLEEKEQFNGWDIILILTVSDQNQSEQKITTFKRISLTSKTSVLNSNPTIGGDFEADEVVLNSFPEDLVELKVSGLSSPETYQLKTSEETLSLTENMTVTWFGSEGSFVSSRTIPENSTEYDPKEATAGVFTAVYRDDRGGVAVIRKVLP